MKPLNIACLMTYEMSMFSDYKKQNWLVVWNITFTNFPTLGIIVPTDLQMFQRDLNHQADMRLYCLKTVLRVTWVLSDKQIPWHRVVYNALLWKVLFLGISHFQRHPDGWYGLFLGLLQCESPWQKTKCKTELRSTDICYEGRRFDTAWPGACWMNVWSIYIYRLYTRIY